MVGALFWCKGDGLVYTTAGVALLLKAFPFIVKLFKHIHYLTEYDCFDTNG